MSSITSSSASRQRIHASTPIAPPIAPPYQTSPEPEKMLLEEMALDFAVVLDQEVPARADDPADERREDDLVRPVHRTVQLAQAPRDQQPAREEAEREDHAEALDRYAEHVEGWFHARAL